MKKTDLLFVLIIAIVISLGCKFGEPQPSTTTEVPQQPPAFDYSNDVKGGDLPSIYNEKIKTPKAERISVTGMAFLLETLKLAEKTGWKGSKGDKLNIKPSDYPEGFLSKLADSDLKKNEDLKIAEDLNEIFLSDKAQKEIVDEVFLARGEFIDFLQKSGVRKEYIDEFNNVTFPNDRSRFTYIAKDDPNAPITGVQPLEKGGREYKYFLQTIDIYLPALLLKQSAIVGDEPAEEKKKLEYFKLLRNIALRATTYHEMTHILQAAANRVNTPNGFKYPSKYVEGVDAGNAYRWGDTVLKDIQNRDIMSESQADGFSFVVLTKNYNMSRVQKEQVWDFTYGRLENGSNAMNEVMRIFDAKFRDYDPWDFAPQVAEEVILEYKYKDESLTREQWAALERNCDRIDLSAYAGYFNPMTPAQVDQVINFLKKIHRQDYE